MQQFYPSESKVMPTGSVGSVPCIRMQAQSKVMPTGSVGLAPCIRMQAEGDVPPRSFDILSGRGGKSNKHSGNLIYRCLVENSKQVYLKATNQLVKKNIVDSIVGAIERRGARFMKKEEESTTGWKQLTFLEASQKVRQALREPECTMQSLEFMCQSRLHAAKPTHTVTAEPCPPNQIVTDDDGSHNSVPDVDGRNHLYCPSIPSIPSEYLGVEEKQTPGKHNNIEDDLGHESQISGGFNLEGDHSILDFVTFNGKMSGDFYWKLR